MASCNQVKTVRHQVKTDLKEPRAWWLQNAVAVLAVVNQKVATIEQWIVTLAVQEGAYSILHKGAKRHPAKRSLQRPARRSQY